MARAAEEEVWKMSEQRSTNGAHPNNLRMEGIHLHLSELVRGAGSKIHHEPCT